MQIDRRELMNLAWHSARQELWSHRLPASALPSLFPNALRTAWREADGTWFKWFDIRSFPPEPSLVIAAHNARKPH